MTQPAALVRRGLPSRRAAVGVLVVLGVGLLAAGRATWVTARAWTALADAEVAVDGPRAAPVVSAAGLLVLAAALVLAIGRRVAATLAGGVAAAGGACALVGAIAVARDADAVAAAGALRSVGVGTPASDVALTPVVWLAVALAAATVAAGTGAVLAARRWPVSARHEAPASAAAVPPDDWTALSLGDDPSAGPVPESTQEPRPGPS